MSSRYCSFVNDADAGRRAALDLVLQARPRAVAEVAVFAVANEEQLLQFIQRLAHRASARVRPEVTPFALARAAVKFAAAEIRGRVDA